MFVFLDFEASSLSKRSYPIEVGWVFEDGRSDAFLIRPAPPWDDWDEASEAIHRISHAELHVSGADHDFVARTMIERLAGHDLLASAPSWDGKWLSTLLRACGLPRHSLRLRSTDEGLRDVARSILAERLDGDRLEEAVASLVALTARHDRSDPPAHRALADARDEHRRWQAVRRAALELLNTQTGSAEPALQPVGLAMALPWGTQSAMTARLRPV